MNYQESRVIVETEETGAERFLRDVLMREGECRFRIEVMMSDKTIRHYNLHAVSKQRAIYEGQQFIQQMVTTFRDERVIWRIPGVTAWSVVSERSMASEAPITKKETWWTRFVDKFFDVYDD